MKDNKFQLLMVEDEENLALSLKYNLEVEGYDVHTASDGRAAVQAFLKTGYDLILLDIGLPQMDGFEVLKIIRKTSKQIPVLILTARTAAADRVHGLELGADDYLAKPFHLTELILRVKGMLRRKMWYEEESPGMQAFKFGINTIDLEKLTASSGKLVFPITTLEASLLSYLIKNSNKIISKEELLVNVWNIDSETETRTVENFIVRLRRYFEPVQRKPIYFRTLRGAGYIFTPSGKI